MILDEALRDIEPWPDLEFLNEDESQAKPEEPAKEQHSDKQEEKPQDSKPQPKQESKSAIRVFLAQVKKIYTLSDEQIANNERGILRTITRWILLAGIWRYSKCLAVLAFFMSRRLRKIQTRKDRERLVVRLSSEVRILEEKIAKEQDQHEKEKMIRLKDKYNYYIAKATHTMVKDEIKKLEKRRR